MRKAQHPVGNDQMTIEDGRRAGRLRTTCWSWSSCSSSKTSSLACQTCRVKPSKDFPSPSYRQVERAVAPCWTKGIGSPAISISHHTHNQWVWYRTRKRYSESRNGTQKTVRTRWLAWKLENSPGASRSRTSEGMLFIRIRRHLKKDMPTKY